MAQRPFHLAFPVADLEETRKFYGELLGCSEARSTPNWVDFDLYGNSISAYLHPEEARREIPSNLVDTTDSPKKIPVRHFGVILKWEEWEELVDRLKQKGVKFIIGPLVRFEGRNGEQTTIYFNDPCGNVVEFKAFRNPETRFTPFDDDYA
jgi:extradiol dioxygenase family protein